MSVTSHKEAAKTLYEMPPGILIILLQPLHIKHKKGRVVSKQSN